MCTREDAAGAEGMASVPAALAIEAVACEPPGAVDLIDRRHRMPDTWHFSPAEWVEFLAAVKAGRYDGAGGDDAGMSEDLAVLNAARRWWLDHMPYTGSSPTDAEVLEAYAKQHPEDR